MLNFWKFTSYCSLKHLWSGMGEVVPARTSPTLHPPSPPTVHQLSRLALWELTHGQMWWTPDIFKIGHVHLHPFKIQQDWQSLPKTCHTKVNIVVMFWLRGFILSHISITPSVTKGITQQHFLLQPSHIMLLLCCYAKCLGDFMRLCGLAYFAHCKMCYSETSLGWLWTIWKQVKSKHLTLKVLYFWKFTSYCSLNPLWSGMGEVLQKHHARLHFIIECIKNSSCTGIYKLILIPWEVNHKR